MATTLLLVFNVLSLWHLHYLLLMYGSIVASCSLFAAKAGASGVVAVDGSAKMVSVATQVCFCLLLVPN
jgi:hypothetical protein